MITGGEWCSRIGDEENLYLVGLTKNNRKFKHNYPLTTSRVYTAHKASLEGGSRKVYDNYFLNNKKKIFFLFLIFLFYKK